MLTESSRAKRTRAAFTAGLLSMLAASSAGAQTEGSNAIRTIETRRTEGGREIVIHTSAAPTFSVFRLSDPFRILVDISDAKAPDSVGPLTYDDDPVLRSVSTQTFSDARSAIVRVEIALAGKHPYDVKAEGNAIVARIEAPGAPAGEPVTAASAAIGKLTFRAEKEKVLFSAAVESGSLSPDKVAITQLEDPTRVVVDITGAVANPKFQKLEIKQHGLTRARVGTSEQGVRIVVDLDEKSALPNVEVDAFDGKLVMTVVPAAKPAPAPVAEVAKPAPAAEPEPAAAVATQPAPTAPEPREETATRGRAGADVVRIEDIRFEPKDGFVRLSIDLSRSDSAVAKDAGSTRGMPVIRISKARLPEAFVRTLDTSAVAGDVVRAISTYNEGDDVLIAARVGSNTEHRHWRKGGRLLWDFRTTAVEPAKQPADESAEARVLDYPEQATSGFESTAEKVSSALGPTQRRRYRGRRISLDLKDADIINVLRLLADVSKLNIVASDDVKGKVTLKLRNVPWDQALDIILQSKKLDKTRNGNIIRVAPIEVLEQEEQLRLSRKEAQAKLEPMSVRLIPVNYATAADVSAQVSAVLSQRGKVNVDARTNVLVVEDVAEVLLKVERLVRTLDTQTPQVLIEARIVEAATNFARDLGIQWGGKAHFTPAYGNQTGLEFPNTVRISGGSDTGAIPTSGVLRADNGFAVNLPAAAGLGAGGAIGFVFGSASQSSLLSLRLTAAESSGKTKIVSAPKVVTLDNRQAKILSGEKIPITIITANGPSTSFVDANLELGVTPHVTADGSIVLKIEAKKNELSQRVDILGTPGIITREARTEMLVRDGDTAVLGGIYRRTAVESKAYVPWIGQVPVLGWLFKKSQRSDSREELLIFISPRIVNRSQALVTGR